LSGAGGYWIRTRDGLTALLQGLNFLLPGWLFLHRIIAAQVIGGAS